MSYQSNEFLKQIYSNKSNIFSRGQFLKENSNRKYSIRDILKDLLSKPNQLNILDVGAGNCTFIKDLAKEFPQNRYFALDIVENDICSDLVNIDYRLYDGKVFPKYEQKIDIVILMHMLYHVENHENFFKGLKKLLNEKYRIFVTTKSKYTFPAIENIFQTVLNEISDSVLKNNITHYRDESHFCLENGQEIIEKNLEGVKINKYVLETQIITKNYTSVLNYILSTPRYNLEKKLSKDKFKEYQKKWQTHLSDKKFFIDKYIEVIYEVEN